MKFDPIVDQLMSNIEARFKDYRRLSPLETEIAEGIKYLRKWWGQVDETQPDKNINLFVVTRMGGTPITGGTANTLEKALLGIPTDGRVQCGVRVYKFNVRLGDEEHMTLSYDELKSYRKKLKEEGR